MRTGAAHDVARCIRPYEAVEWLTSSQVPFVRTAHIFCVGQLHKHLHVYSVFFWQDDL